MKNQQKFWSHVKKCKSGCWEWTGYCDGDGYGCCGSSIWGSTNAHRVSWEHKYGPIPKGLCVLHSCDNPPCVNPDHLFLGTQKINAVDREYKGRGNHAIGERHGRSKLTSRQICNIRNLYGLVSGITLSRIYCVTSGAIYHIINRRNWKHI